MCKRRFSLRLKGPAEVYADAVLTQSHITQVYKESVTSHECRWSMGLAPTLIETTPRQDDTGVDEVDQSVQ